jgi:hypothetical protein
MNWRDPKTDLVHIIQAWPETMDTWGMKLSWDWARRMACGLVVRVDKDNCIVPTGTSSEFPIALVHVPWVHANDHPTCIACVVEMPLAFGHEVAVTDYGDEEQDD